MTRFAQQVQQGQIARPLRGSVVTGRLAGRAIGAHPVSRRRNSMTLRLNSRAVKSSSQS